MKVRCISFPIERKLKVSSLKFDFGFKFLFLSCSPVICRFFALVEYLFRYGAFSFHVQLVGHAILTCKCNVLTLALFKSEVM